MADFVYERDQEMTVVVLRIPRRAWDSWEYRHGHYGKALHAARESLLELMVHKALTSGWRDQGDPFYADR